MLQVTTRFFHLRKIVDVNIVGYLVSSNVAFISLSPNNVVFK